MKAGRTVVAAGLGALLLSCPRAPPTHTELPESWQRAVPVTDVPAGLKGLHATDCAGCHADVVAEWRPSAHAQSWVDPQFQAEWHKDKELWLCVGCHAPLENQQPSVVTGLIEGDLLKPVRRTNPRFDAALRDEGIGCAACHVREGQVVTARALVKNAPHPVRVDPDALSMNACLRCHNAKANVSDTLVCSFDTGDDWRSTDLPVAGVTCIDCHLPPVERVTGKAGRSHDFRGAGIAKEGASDGRTGLVVSVEWGERPLARGATANVEAVITNAGAGHSIPTGDVERWSQVAFSLVDENGSVLWSQGERIGERWEWYPVAKQLEDTSLRRGAQRRVRLPLPIPADRRELRLHIVVTNHRMTPQTHAWAKLPQSYPLSAEASRSIIPVPLGR